MNLERTAFAPLAAHLLDLLTALEKEEIPLILIGGFGLFLRRQWLLESQTRTLFERVPASRATEDFDLVLRLELLADLPKMTAFRAALDGLGYQVVQSAQIYQFVKPNTAWGGARDVKVDLLAREPSEGDPALWTDARRVKPSASQSPLHARLTPEAIAVEDTPARGDARGNPHRWDSGAGRHPVVVCVRDVPDETLRLSGRARRIEARRPSCVRPQARA